MRAALGAVPWADVLFVLAATATAYTVVLALLLLVSQAAAVRRVVPWQSRLWLTAALWLVWVVIR